MNEDRAKAQHVSLDRQSWRLFVRMIKNLVTSPEVGTTAIVLFGVLIGFLLLINGLNVVNSYVGRDFMTAISQRDRAGFVWYATAYAAVFAGSTVVDVLYGFTVGRLGLLWRVWLTQRFVTRYLEGRSYYHLISTSAISNPDQRITEDVRTLATTTLTFVLLVLNGGFTIMAFSGVLWSISPLLFAVAVAYAAGGSFLTIVLGRPLVWLNYNQSDKEAAFRADLVHLGGNAESVALAHREGVLKSRLLRHLDELAANFKQIIAVSRNLGFFTTGYNYLIQIIPALIVAPLYIRGHVEFGVITQSAMAFSQLLGAFSLIVNQFQSISSYAAVLVRLGALSEAIDSAQAASPAGLEVVEDDGRVAFEGVTVRAMESGPALVDDLSVSIPHGTRCLIGGPDETAKLSLFRATAGIRDHAQGRVIRPALDRVLFLSERPYLPPGTLRELLACGDAHSVNSERIQSVLAAFRLQDIVARAGGLDIELDWDDFLTLGEQQLVALARAVFAAPRFAFLDRISNILSPEQTDEVLRILSDHSITYLTLRGPEDRVDRYDTLLELSHNGSWKVDSGST